jgi:hypothetical protein
VIARLFMKVLKRPLTCCQFNTGGAGCNSAPKPRSELVCVGASDPNSEPSGGDGDPIYCPKTQVYIPRREQTAE